MGADIMSTVRGCTTWTKNQMSLVKKPHLIRLFSAMWLLESVAISILRPLSRINREVNFIVLITDHFRKPTQILTLLHITAYHVEITFGEHGVFKYGSEDAVVR